MADVFSGMTPVTMAEWQSLVPDSDVAKKVFIQTVRDYQPFFDRATMVRGNDGQGMKGTLADKYPEGQLVGINEGWGASTPTGRAVRYPSCIARDRSVIGKLQLERMPEKDRAPYRARKDQMFTRGLTRGMVKRVFQGNPDKDPRDCLGLANIVLPDKDNGAWKNSIVDAGGTVASGSTSTLTSIYFVNWHPEEMTLFFPENGGAAGISVEVQKSLIYVPDANGKMFPAYVTEFGYDLGVFAGNPENIVRIANVDTSKITTAKGAADLLKLFVEARHRLRTDDFSHVGIYCTDQVGMIYDLQLLEKTKYTLEYKTFGKREGMLSFGGIPIYQYGTDVLNASESAITIS